MSSLSLSISSYEMGEWPFLLPASDVWGFLFFVFKFWFLILMIPARPTTHRTSTLGGGICIGIWHFERIK